MPKMIDGEKLLEYITTRQRSGDGSEELYSLEQLVHSGTFDPTPPVQPTLQRGDKVRHKDFKNRGPGVVMLAMGQKAQVYFEKTEIGQPVKAYYRLDKLEVITDDTTS